MASESGGTRRIARSVRALILSPAVLLFASAIRLLIISNYDPTVATAIAASGGVTGTLLGTIIPLIPPFLPALVLALIIFQRWALAGFAILGTALVAPAHLPVSVAANRISDGFSHFWDFMQHPQEWANLKLGILWIDMQWLLIFSGVALVVALIEWLPRGLRWFKQRKNNKGIFPLGVADVVIFCLGTSLFFLVAASFVTAIYRIPGDIQTIAIIVRRPWLPAEQIDLKSGEIKVGYIFSTKDGWNSILTEKSRVIEYVKADEVKARHVCDVEGHASSRPAPIIKLIDAQAVPLRPCPNP